MESVVRKSGMPVNTVTERVTNPILMGTRVSNLAEK
jgi:hypothetical protein